MPVVNSTKDFIDNSALLQTAERTVVNDWVAAMVGGANVFDAAKTVSKEIKKLQGTPAVAKTGTHELLAGTVNRVFFKYDATTVTLTNVGHT